MLPYLMALNTLTTAVVAAGYLRLYKHFSLREAVAFSFLFYLAGTLLFWYWTSVQAWSVISSRLLVRQARRSLGLIGGGAIVGGIAGGLFAQFFAGIWNVQALLPIASFFIFLALISGYLMSNTLQIAEETAISEAKTTVRRRLVVLLMVVVGALTIVSTFADFQFKVISQQEVGSAKSLAIFFGAFYANLGVITLIFKVFATPALMRRLGLKVTLSVLPVALLTGNTFLLVARSLWGAIFLKGSEQLFRFSLDRSSMEVIYLAIPEKERVRIKALVDTVGCRLFEATASGILILLFTLAHFPLWVIAALSIGFCCVAITAIVLLGQEY
jgi:AAA family ATP:ADP antiporter